MRKLNSIVVTMLAWAGASQLMAEDLLAVYQDALVNDAEFTAALAQFASILERVPQSRAALLPSVTLNATSIQNHNDRATSGNQQNYGTGYSVRLSQPLFRWDSKITYDQTKTLVRQAEAELELARQDLILRVSQVYFDVLLAGDTLATLETEKKAIAEELAAATRRFEVGTANITDVRDSKARFDLVKAQAIAASNEVDAKQEELRTITNRVPEKLLTLKNAVQLLGPTPAKMDDWVDSAVRDGFAVIAKQAALDIADLETDKAQAGHYPTLNLTASVGDNTAQNNNGGGTGVNEPSVGVEFSLPIFSGGATIARQRETTHLLEKAGAELDGARRNGALGTRQAFLRTTSGLAQVAALQEALGSAKTALAANRRGLELGVLANIDVLNSQKQVSQTERDLARARYETLLALLKLKAASGRLGERDVVEVNALLGA